jgi:glycosyltransferase involved in cell wall biosynthesis
MSLRLLLGPQLLAFAEQGYEVLGLSAPGPHVPWLEEHGVRHVPLRFATRSMAPHRDLAALRELYQAFRALRPQIVHTHNPKPGVYGRIAARAARVPVIVNTVHGLYALPDDHRAKRAVVYGLERLASTCSDAELVQNPEDIPVLRRIGVPAEKLHLLGNGVDLDRFDPERVDLVDRTAARAGFGLTADDVAIGFVGRLVVEKGLRELVEAAALVRALHPEARFLVVGPDDPQKSDALNATDRRAALAAGLQLLGERDDVERFYRAIDVFVLPSWREGFPRAAMEAAAMGVPIVATDIRGCRQVVDDGHTGLLVPVRDPGALGTALSELLANADRRAAFGAAARAKAVAEFDQQRVIDITLATYERLSRSGADR